MQQAQQLAATAVHRVLGGSALPAVLAALPTGDESAGRRRALVQELAYGTLRYWGYVDAAVASLAAKPLADPLLRTLLGVAVYQIEHTRAPPFAIVDHAVAAAAELVRPAAKGVANAILRRYLRERDAIRAALADRPVARYSYPAWWIERVRADFPDAWQAILGAGNERPPLTLRANLRVGTRDELLHRFRAAGIEALPAAEAGIIVESPRPVQGLPGFDVGAFSVQDLGAQLAAPLLQLADGLRVLDACAAPGGKTAHMAELADVGIVAVDNDAARLARVGANLARLQIDRSKVTLVEGDAGAPQRWWDGQPFDRILADVPCTASGIVRRHPDGKWLRRPGDIGSLARAQRRIVDALWPCLAPGGLLLYATCSVFAEENEQQARDFAIRHGDALREPISFAPEVLHRDGQLLPSPPGAPHNQDGFFYALFRKR